MVDRLPSYILNRIRLQRVARLAKVPQVPKASVRKDRVTGRWVAECAAARMDCDTWHRAMATALNFARFQAWQKANPPSY